MREATIDLIRKLYGEPTSNTEKVLRWKVSPTLDIVVEDRGENGSVWVPHRDGIKIPPFAKYYSPKDGRNSNTYPAPTLAEGLPVVCLTISKKGQFVRLKKHLDALKTWKPNALAKNGRSDIIVAADAVGDTLTVLGTALSLGGPTAVVGKPIVLTGKAIKSVTGYFKKREEKKEERNLRILVTHLQNTVRSMQSQTVPEETKEVFADVIAAALKEDDARKLYIHAELGKWVLEVKPDPYQVRIFSDAIRNLSYVELYVYAQVVRKKAVAHGLIENLKRKPSNAGAMALTWVNESLMYSRLVSNGLAQDTSVRTEGSPTYFGRKVVEWCGEKMIDPQRPFSEIADQL